MDLAVAVPNIESVSSFFSAIRRVNPIVAEAFVAPEGGNVFQSDSDGLLTCILLEQQTSPELQAILDNCKQHLINLCGLASAYVRHQADSQKNPNLVYDTNMWQTVFNHLPLMGPSKFSMQNYSQTCKGVEIATKFLEEIVETVASGGASVADFGKFIQGLGGSIQAGYNSGHKEYHVGAITITLEEVKIGSESDILPKLKGYFIDFTEDQREWSSNCASYNSYSVGFSYRAATSVFNYKALNDPTVKANFDALISGSQIDDIKKSNNFFNGNA